MMAFFNCCSINRLCLVGVNFAFFVISLSVIVCFLAEKIHSGVFCDNEIEAVLCNVWRCPPLLCRRTSVAMVKTTVVYYIRTGRSPNGRFRYIISRARCRNRGLRPLHGRVRRTYPKKEEEEEDPHSHNHCGSRHYWMLHV